MDVLFAGMVSMEDFGAQSIYADLLREFASRGHRVAAMAPRERRGGLPTELSREGGVDLLKVAVGNVTKVGLVEKGLSTLAIGGQYWSAYKKHLDGRGFDLVVYATPPTTLNGFVTRVKGATGARAYLLLKDIFPQNSLDLGMLSEHGLKGAMYRYFKKSERKTYEAADWIGCMSPANREYLLAHEPWLDPARVEVAPNSLSPRPVPEVDAAEVRGRYGIPPDVPALVYGGSLGAPQDPLFITECLAANEAFPVGHMVVAGAGTGRPEIERWFEAARPSRATLLPMLPRAEFDGLVAACDAGLVFLDRRFTIPNFPSRLLSYMQAAKPVVCSVDAATDVGRIAEASGFGACCPSGDARAFLAACWRVLDEDPRAMGERARRYFEENYTADRTYETIMRHFG